MKVFKNVLTFLLVMIIALPVLIIANSYSKYKSALKELPLDEKVAEIRSQENFCTISDVPQLYIDAVVSVEDRRFYSHNGFDFVGTLRAVITDIKTRSLQEGGSTISQQLAKNMYFPQDNTIERKIAEIFLAMEIEKEYSKNDVLELYFNCIYYGSGYYCIYDAAKGYFGKEPADMNAYESTLLAGVPNAPSVYSPKVNLKLSHKRQEKVLATMVDNNILTQNEADEILACQGE